jgi:hypothetical protein
VALSSYGDGDDEDRAAAAKLPGAPIVLAGAAVAAASIPVSTDPAATVGTATNPGRAPPPAPRDPEDGLAVDAAQRLIVNEGLLTVFDHYLRHPVSMAGGGDQADLLAYLRPRLPAPALEDARQLAGRYIDYMQLHDRQLALQWPGPCRPTDLTTLGAWIAQRQQLRLSTLGPEATQGFYQNEVAALGQALQELAQREGGSTADNAAAASPVPHWQDPTAEAAHVQGLHEMLRGTMTAYRPQQSASPSTSQAGFCPH